MSRSASHIYNCVLNAEFISGLISSTGVASLDAI